MIPSNLTIVEAHLTKVAPPNARDVERCLHSRCISLANPWRACMMASELGHATNGHQSSPTQKPPKLVVASYSIGIRRAPLLPFGSIWGLGSPVGCHGVLPCSTAYVLQFGPRHCGDLLRLIEFLQRQRSSLTFAHHSTSR
jgi:hypothetical protein